MLKKGNIILIFTPNMLISTVNRIKFERTKEHACNKNSAIYSHLADC